MTVRAVEGKKLWTGGNAVEVDNEQKTIRLRLRDENNLIIYDVGDDEIYTDLQLNNEVRPTDAFPVGVTTGRVIVDNGWDVTGTILIFKTTSGDYVELLYGDDGKLYTDNGTGSLKQIYLKGEVDALLQALREYIDQQLATKQDVLTAGEGINIDTNNVISNIQLGALVSDTAPSNPSQGDLWYDTTTDELKNYTGAQWDTIGKETYSAGTGIDITNDTISVDSTVAKDSDLNTKTFYLASTSDLTTAQAVYDWYSSGKNPIISLGGTTYIVKAKLPTYLAFVDGTINSVTGGVVSIICDNGLNLMITDDTVTSIQIESGTSRNTAARYLATDIDYQSTYTPLYDGSPATKKYVDEHGPVIPVYSYHGDFNSISFDVEVGGDYRIVVTGYHSGNLNRTTTITVDGTTIATYTTTVIQTFTYQCIASPVGGTGSTITIAKDSSTAFEYHEVFIEKINLQSGYLNATVS